VSSCRHWSVPCSKCAEGVDGWVTELAVLLTRFSFLKAHSIAHCNRDESESHKYIDSKNGKMSSVLKLSVGTIQVKSVER
jgi:hypothetical protein